MCGNYKTPGDLDLGHHCGILRADYLPSVGSEVKGRQGNRDCVGNSEKAGCRRRDRGNGKIQDLHRSS